MRTGAAAIIVVLAVSGIGAAPAPAESSGLCIPLLVNCSTPTPSPSPSGGSSSGGSGNSPILPGLPAIPGVGGVGGDDGSHSALPVPSVIAVPDTTAPTMTLPAAQLGGSSISFSGLKAVSVVTVPLANGSRATVLKLEADDIVITDFLLDVRKSTGPSLVSTADRMELKGHVQVYVDSATGTLLNGMGLSIGAATPPPQGELPSQLLRVTLGLVGVTANSISFSNSHQQLK